MRQEILIRTDGNATMGLGHVIRCIALGQMLKEDFQIIFFSKEIPDSTQQELIDNGFGFNKVNHECEFLNFIEEGNIVVIDGYHFDTNYQKKIKAKRAKLVCIDDLHDKEFVADLIINHAPGVRQEDYKARSNTKFALGLDFALLRKPFLVQAKLKRKINFIENVLICFGGSDYNNMTQLTLETVKLFNKFKKIIVITGPSFKKTAYFNKVIESDNRIDYRSNLDESQMFASMLESQLAIVPASGILYETLSTGNITITGQYVKNQKNIYSGFELLKAVIPVLTFEYSDLFNAIENISTFKLKSIIDGNSDKRIIDIFSQLDNNEDTTVN